MGNAQHNPQPAGHICIFCKNERNCGKCDGRGVHEALVGRKRVKTMVECRACEGSGQCPLCHGQGVMHG